MRKNSTYNIAFAKHTPSVFIIASPFQLLCAIEAIHEFEISEYKFVFAIIKDWPRNEQMFAVAKEYAIDYDVIWYNSNVNEYFDISSGKYQIPCSGKYERVFIGDNNYAYNFFLIPRYAKEGAVVAYLDDGNSTIMVLNGIIEERLPENWRARLHWYRHYSTISQIGQRNAALRDFKRIGIIDSAAFYTIYHNIKSRLYATYPNTFHYLLSASSNQKRRDVVIIIGSIIDVQAERTGIELSHMEAIAWNKLADVRHRHPENDIVYIPHARDTSTIIPQFCAILGITYSKINEPIESYCIKSNFNPIAIYGFISTAHTTLKRIFPDSNVTYWPIKSMGLTRHRTQMTKTYQKYYKQCGIRMEEVWVDRHTIMIHNTTIKNVKSLLHLVFDKITGYKFSKRKLLLSRQ